MVLASPQVAVVAAVLLVAGNIFQLQFFSVFWGVSLDTVSTCSGGMKGGSKVVVEPHRHQGVFIARGKEDALLTKNTVPGESVYGEKRISVEVRSHGHNTFAIFFFVDFFPSLARRRTVKRSSTVCGTPSDPRLPPQSLVVLTISTLLLA